MIIFKSRQINSTQLKMATQMSHAADILIESLTHSHQEIVLKLNLLHFQIDRLNELISNNSENLQKVVQFRLKLNELEEEKDKLNQELLENQIAQQDIEENVKANKLVNALDDLDEVHEVDELDEEDDEKLENYCLDCDYEWRDGYKEGWQKAMQYFEKNIKKTVEKTVAMSAKICSNCNVDYQLLKCNGTCNGEEYYCSEECQKVHWNAIHRFECSKL